MTLFELIVALTPSLHAQDWELTVVKPAQILYPEGSKSAIETPPLYAFCTETVDRDLEAHARILDKEFALPADPLNMKRMFNDYDDGLLHLCFFPGEEILRHSGAFSVFGEHSSASNFFYVFERYISVSPFVVNTDQAPVLSFSEYYASGVIFKDDNALGMHAYALYRNGDVFETVELSRRFSDKYFSHFVLSFYKSWTSSFDNPSLVGVYAVDRDGNKSQFYISAGKEYNIEQNTYERIFETKPVPVK